ncbi:unnamed protein product [Prunus armeniaca]|uniref:Uncharacterized protein n=1 Tax=Prunus armeniaca TaxID=36596 RepID=A0A6J5UT15_PRUAR|nr:unnamed protein product [Prunus armeniaca]
MLLPLMMKYNWFLHSVLKFAQHAYQELSAIKGARNINESMAIKELLHLFALINNLYKGGFA